MPTNKSVKKKNQIPSLSMLKMTCIENGSGVTIVPHHVKIVTWVCHNCDMVWHIVTPSTSPGPKNNETWSEWWWWWVATKLKVSSRERLSIIHKQTKSDLP